MIFDITPPITPRLRVWPGDTPPTREVLADMTLGENLTLSTLHATCHLGAHADGPNHYGVDAPAIDARDLSLYLGPCRVVRVAARPGTRVGIDDIAAPIDAERILIHTGTFPDPEEFREDFAALEPSLVDFLADRGVRLVGVNTPSVDLFSDATLAAHRRFLAHDMAILEGLALADVPEGCYELIALPLRLVGFDASPVRAILRALPR